MRNPSLPEIHIGRGFDVVQIRHHAGARFGFVADGADGVVKRLAVFARAGFDVAGRAITAKNCLPVGLGHLQSARAISLGLGRNHGWKNGDFEHEALRAFVGLDIDRLE